MESYKLYTFSLWSMSRCMGSLASGAHSPMISSKGAKSAREVMARRRYLNEEAKSMECARGYSRRGGIKKRISA